MADDMDRAQNREQVDRELALRAHAARIAASFEPVNPASAGFCMDCDGPIEPRRLQVLRGATSRCSDCAHAHEQRMRTEQRGGHARA